MHVKKKNIECIKNDILVTRSSLPPFEEYVNEIRDLWDTHWITNMGVKHQELKKELKEYLHTDNIELLVNGHSALEMSLQALNLKGEVITTPFTFASTVHAIVRNGLTPVFCDIRPDDFTIDPEKIEEKITDNTCAILPVHVYGNICQVEAIEDIAKKYGLKVIYDASHTFGETYNGIGVANFGDVSTFSFHATKVYNTIEGGASCYRDAEVGKRIYDLKNFGIHGPESVVSVGANAKMNEFCAAMGICNLRHVDDEIAKRKKVNEKYMELLYDVDGIQLNAEQPKVKKNYSYFPIVVDEKKYGMTRNELFDLLEYNGIHSRKYFYPLCSDFSCYRDRFQSEYTPVAKHIANRVLTLPMYSDLKLDDVQEICNNIMRLKSNVYR